MPTRFTARYTRRGEPAVAVRVPVLFTLDEASRALALVYHDRLPLSGLNALQQGLARAAAERVLDGGTRPDEQLTEHYRAALIAADVFPTPHT